MECGQKELSLGDGERRLRHTHITESARRRKEDFVVEDESEEAMKREKGEPLKFNLPFISCVELSSGAEKTADLEVGWRSGRRGEGHLGVFGPQRGDHDGPRLGTSTHTCHLDLHHL